MLRLLLIRLVQIPAIIIAMSLLVFIFLNASGDPAQLLMPTEATEEDIEELRRALGLDRPLYIQYWTFLSNALQGDFGTSLRTRQPAINTVLAALPATLALAFAAIIVSTAIRGGCQAQQAH